VRSCSETDPQPARPLTVEARRLLGSSPRNVRRIVNNEYYRRSAVGHSHPVTQLSHILSCTAKLTVTNTIRSPRSIGGWVRSVEAAATSTTRRPIHSPAPQGTYIVNGPQGQLRHGEHPLWQGRRSPNRSGCRSGTVSTAGLVAAYGFEETTGTQAQDASGKANHGALTNVTRSSSRKFGRALSFNGTNSLVTVSDSNSLDLTSAMTLSAWVYPTSWASGWKNLIMKERSGGLAYTLNANSDAGQPNSTVRIGSTDRQLTAGSHLCSNTWTDLAATYDGSRQRLFVNRTQVGSQSQAGSLQVSTNPLRIGGSTVWSSQYFQGLIDRVCIYNRPPSKMEVAAVSQEPVVSAAPPANVCATPCTLRDNATIPSIAAKADYSAVEVGLALRSDVAGQVTGVRFYKGSGNTGTHAGRLWSSSGQLLAQATFTNESASGWQQVNFASPVTITANTT